MPFLPDVRPLGDGFTLPCLAYVGGTKTSDSIRLVGFIDIAGELSDVTVHGPFGCYDVDVVTNRAYGA